MNKNDEKKPNILYIDDEITNLKSFKASFRTLYNIFITTEIEEANILLEENDISILIVDQKMPSISGTQFLASLRDKHQETIRILLTGYTDIDCLIDAINDGKIYHYVNKPWDEKHLRFILDKSYEVYTLRVRNKELMSKMLDLLRILDN